MNCERWKEIKKCCSYDLTNSFAAGEKRLNHVKWFTNFMNAVYYAIDFPNFKISLKNSCKLIFYTLYYIIFNQASKKQRIKNITEPNLEITKS